MMIKKRNNTVFQSNIFLVTTMIIFEFDEIVFLAEVIFLI